MSIVRINLLYMGCPYISSVNILCFFLSWNPVLFSSQICIALGDHQCMIHQLWDPQCHLLLFTGPSRPVLTCTAPTVSCLDTSALKACCLPALCFSALHRLAGVKQVHPSVQNNCLLLPSIKRIWFYKDKQKLNKSGNSCLIIKQAEQSSRKNKTSSDNT